MHPAPDQNTSPSSTFNILGQLTSLVLRSVPFPQWLDLLSGTKLDSRIAPMAPMIAERCLNASFAKADMTDISMGQ